MKMNRLVITLLAGGLTLSAMGLVHADDDRTDKRAYHEGYHCKYKGGAGHSEQRLQRMTQVLGLSADQASRIKAIQDKYSEQKQQLRTKMHESRMQLREAMNAGPVDEAGVQKLAQDMGNLKADMILLHSKIHTEIDQVLTPEQIEKRKQMRGHGGGMYKHHGDRDDV